MAEEEAKHVRELEKTAIKYKAKEVRLGQIFGFLIGIAGFATCIVSLFLGYERPAMIIGGTTIVGLVTVFVVGRSNREAKPKRDK